MKVTCKHCLYSWNFTYRKPYLNQPYRVKCPKCHKKVFKRISRKIELINHPTTIEVKEKVFE